MIRGALWKSLVLLAAELALAVLALAALDALPHARNGTVIGLIVGCLVPVLIVYGLMSARFLAALRGAQRQDPGHVLPAVHHLRRSLGLQAGLRTLVAFTAAGVFATLLTQITTVTTTGLLARVGAISTAVALAEVWRPVVLGSALVRLVAQRGEPELQAQWSRETLRWNLTWTGASTGSAGVLAVAAFVHFFVPLTPSLREVLLAFVPFTVAALGGLWLLAQWRLLRPLRQSLTVALEAPADDPDDPGEARSPHWETPSQAAPAAKRAMGEGPRGRFTRRGEGGRSRPPSETQSSAVVRSFRAVQVLPYTLAAAKAGSFILGALLVYGEGAYLFGMDRETAGLMAAATVLVTFAAALYEVFWHRATLRSVLAALATRHRLDVEAVRSPMSLRVKMFFGFGLVLFFACAISIFWSFLQVRNLAVEFVQKQSKLKAEGLVERLRTQEKLRGPLQPEDVMGHLAQFAVGGEEVYWYLPPAGPPGRFAAPGRSAPPLPFLARTRMRRQERGVLRLNDLGLAGSFQRIRIGKRDLGSVAVLYPDQRRQSTAPGPRTAVLAIFFLVLLALCTGIVALIASDLSAPLLALERRAGEMARGDLQRPVVTGAEADEVGRLAFAMDDMRRSLEEQIRTVEELNVSLEEKVEQRTSDLGQANADLREALDRLTQAQDQLVRSEKLASIGQLVAGVAHELNNPINAVGNTLDPLEEALQQVVRLAKARGVDGAAPDPAGESADAVADVQAMLRVIRNGARRIQRIVQALSGYARSDGERSTAVDLNGVVEETLDIARHLITEADAEVVRKRQDLPPVTGDPGQLGQVVMNLVANAAQAVTGQAQRRIDVETRSEDGFVQVWVSDTGPGVPAELRARIFDPFFTTKEVGAGTGLGLSISHEIVANHGGTLQLEESPSGGASFRVRLPVSRSA